MGRPSSRTPELESEICDRIADGESMRAICGDDHMPDRRTVLRWMEMDDGFATRCARAREMQADAHEESMAVIEQQVLDGSLDPKAANVVLSSRRWRAEKLAPKKYGPRTAMELTGANGGPVRTSDISKTELARRLVLLLAQGAAAAQAAKQVLEDDDGDDIV